MPKTSFLIHYSMDRPIVLVWGEKKYTFDARNAEALLLFEASKGWKGFFAWSLKDLCRLEGPRSPSAGEWDTRGGEGEWEPALCANAAD